MHRTVISAAVIAASILTVGFAGGIAAQSSDDSSDEPTVRMARATWDTGWFQAEVYRILLQRLGYRVEGPITMENPEFYTAVAADEVDLWVNGWFPLHDWHIQAGLVETVGTQVDAGALQGYFVDAATAQAHGITNLG